MKPQHKEYIDWADDELGRIPEYPTRRMPPKETEFISAHPFTKKVTWYVKEVKKKP